MLESALLDAILAAPEDDAPRLVYADWLSERGDPRGEQIAIELALAAPSLDPTARAPLLARLAALRSAIAPPMIAGLEVELRSVRGMLEHAKLTLGALLARDRDLLAVAPLLRSLEIDGVDEPGLDALLARPWFARLRSLEMYYHVPGAAVIAVARSPAAHQLTRLSIHHAALPTTAYAALGASEHLVSLRELDLGLSGADDAAVAALLPPGALPTVTSLGLTNNRLGTAACETLAGHAGPLEALALGWNRLGHRGVTAIARSPLGRGLRSLDLDHVQTGARGCAALAEARLSLHALHVRSSKIDDIGARHLMHSPTLTASLRTLDLRNNPLSAAVTAELRTHFGARVDL